MLKIYPLGGCGEIGMNMTVLQINKRSYFIDCGALFPDASLLGVQLIIPDVRHLEKHKIVPQAWLITHGHEDHIGALPYLFPKFPEVLYAPPFAAELIYEKMKDRGQARPNIKLWKVGKTESFPDLKVTPFMVNHSIPDSLGFFMETKFGNILHTGDYRIDANSYEDSTTDQNILNILKTKNVKLMLSDSTNSFVEGRDNSENDLVAPFKEIMEKTRGTVIATTFASNIWRLSTIVNAAQQANRRVHFLGRSMRRNIEIANRLGLMKLNMEDIVEEEKLKYIRKAELCIICTGSQGESNAGLQRIADRAVGNISLEFGDAVVFSSRAIPGNEKSINEVINKITRRNARVITSRDMTVHVSGHGYQEDLKDTIKAAKPQFFMPVHGEFKHLQKHTYLASESGVPLDNSFLVENGDVLRLDKDRPEYLDAIDSGRMYVLDGGQVVPSDSEILKQRVNIGRGGSITVSYVASKPHYDLMTPPICTLHGILIDEDLNSTRTLEDLFHKSIKEFRKKGFSLENLQDNLRISIRRYLETRIQYKCVVDVILHIA